MADIPLHVALKEARLRAGYANANQAAEALGISYNTINRAESGEMTPNVSTLRTLAVGYRLRADAFTKEALDPKPPEDSLTVNIHLPVKLTPVLRIALIEGINAFADSFARTLNSIHKDTPA